MNLKNISSVILTLLSLFGNVNSFKNLFPNSLVLRKSITSNHKIIGVCYLKKNDNEELFNELKKIKNEYINKNYYKDDESLNNKEWGYGPKGKLKNIHDLAREIDDSGEFHDHDIETRERDYRVRYKKRGISKREGYKKSNIEDEDDYDYSPSERLYQRKKSYNKNDRNMKKNKFEDEESNKYYLPGVYRIKKDPIGVRIFYDKDDPPPEKIMRMFRENDENDPEKNHKKKKNPIKSENFEIGFYDDFNFTNIGGYNLIKEELIQCADILVNFTKYDKFNVRTPKGIMLEGPPGNGKTMMAKAFSGEIGVGFISVSGSQFQEKYVGVGASRVREIFKLASENTPCIIFVDEIDAIGRKRSSESESSGSERDTTLNELLVELDGFKSSNGIFLIGATNRIDLLDEALIRPGRIDKKIFIGKPDKQTRKEIIDIHLKGKPSSSEINNEKLAEMTGELSSAEIENFLNEAMLFALRKDKKMMTMNDLEIVHNRILTGWQSSENKLSSEMLKQIAIHEMGHAITAAFLEHKNISKVSINLWSPKSLGFTLFESNDENNKICSKDILLKEIMTLLGGRVAEEIFFGNEKISNGASDDMNKVKNIIHTMVIDYGMGKNTYIGENSDKNKERIDIEVEEIFNDSYLKTKRLLLSSKDLLNNFANQLTIEREISGKKIYKKINESRYSYLIEN